ncbi:hypothetical protein [Chroococcidiopsis sp. CCNUC1]|uniref:hypothetical protein n=1 Tax=Chroococcidiopsis sp. CCNUC1 TaxID=2653189 RepID=UPI002021F9E1|nr:hypothetical protein [Chroococcidiopsis sp. CCNUC1]URD48501.1 hypothetical protein M5J74_19425 [Chroococcidiopsis sp. CCNUC1]
MATINISDLRPTGSELFSDSETYMNELGDNELDDINGGTGGLIRSIIAVSKGVGKGASRAYRGAKSAVYRYSPQINQSLNDIFRPGGGLY